jgi:hypothetical protein
MERDPASVHVRLIAGKREVVNVRVWRDEEEDDDQGEVVVTPDHGDVATAFDQTLVLPCAPDEDFVRSLYRCVLHREPSNREIQTEVKRMQGGVLRQQIVTDVLLGPEYESLRPTGSRFITDACQAIYARQPTETELNAWPRTWRRVIVGSMFKNQAHLIATQGCDAKWRKTPTGKQPRTSYGDEQVQDPVRAAHEECMTAYNEMAKLMAAGKGDTPEGKKAYQKYIFAKEKYEKAVAGSPPGRPEPDKGEIRDTDSVPAAGGDDGLRHGAVSRVAAKPGDLPLSGPGVGVTKGSVKARSFYPSADSYVYAYTYRNWNKSNRGVYDVLQAGWHPAGGESRAYLKFDLSGVDPDSVGKATLRLFHYHTGGSNSLPVGIHAVNGVWQEGGGTYHSGQTEKPAAPGEICWIHQPSFDPRPVALVNPGPGTNKRVEVDITPLVKAWLSGTPNNGLMIKPEGKLSGRTPEAQYGFRSREFEAPEKRPVLILYGN